MSTPAALHRRRDYAGPALFSYGFRPFFLAAGLWARSASCCGCRNISATSALPTAFRARSTGTSTRCCTAMLPPAVAGFLLTAIPNWTGRLPVSGLAAGGAGLLWLAGRVAILFSVWIGGIAAR